MSSSMTAGGAARMSALPVALAAISATARESKLHASLTQIIGGRGSAADRAAAE